MILQSFTFLDTRERGRGEGDRMEGARWRGEAEGQGEDRGYPHLMQMCELVTIATHINRVDRLGGRSS